MTEEMLKVYAAVADKLFAPTETGKWLESLTPIIRAQQEEERDYERYVAQRDMGFNHEAIRRFFTSKHADEFENWYRIERSGGSNGK